MPTLQPETAEDFELDEDILLVVKGAASIEQKIRILTGIEYTQSEPTGLNDLIRAISSRCSRDIISKMHEIRVTRNNLIHSLKRIPDQKRFTELCDQIEEDLKQRIEVIQSATLPLPSIASKYTASFNKSEFEIQKDPRNVNGVKVKESLQTSPTGKIKDMKIDLNVDVGTSDGMTITPIFTINNSDGQKCELIVSFLQDFGDEPKLCKDTKAPTVFDLQFTPCDGKTDFDDLCFKIPYERLPLIPSECVLKFNVRLYSYAPGRLVEAAVSEWGKLSFSPESE